MASAVNWQLAPGTNPAVSDKRRTVHEGAGLVEELGSEGDAELCGNGRQAALAPAVACVPFRRRRAPRLKVRASEHLAVGRGAEQCQRNTLL